MPQPTADQGTFNNELRGAMFRNDKGDNPNRPDYRGRCQIDGKPFRISGWVRQARTTGQNYLSLAFTADEAAPVPTPPDVPAQPVEEDPLPF